MRLQVQVLDRDTRVVKKRGVTVVRANWSEDRLAESLSFDMMDDAT